MVNPRIVGGAALIGSAIWVPAALAQAQSKPDEERVEVIVSHPENAQPQSRTLRGLFKAIKAKLAQVSGHVLPMTKCEKWTVRKKDLEAVKKAAAEKGVLITQLEPGSPQLMHAAPDESELTEKQKAMVELARASKATLGVKIMMAPPPAVLEHALTADVKDASGASQPAKITVAFSDNTSITIVRNSVDIKPDMCIWRGTVEGTEGQVTLMWWANGKMTGTVQGRGRPQSIRHLGGSLYAVVEMGEDRLPHEHAPLAQRAQGDPTLRDDPLVRQGDASTAKPNPAPPKAAPVQPAKQQAPKAALPAKPVTIDVIVAYTRKAAQNYSDVRRELVELSLEEANHSFRMSNLGNVRLRLVHAYETDYVEQGQHFDHVWRFADRGDGYMEEIHGLRDKHRADVAILIVDDPQGCGLSTRVFADENEAFAVVHHECAVTTYSLAHEIGHLIGARHDLNLDNSMTPFAYGHGYVNGTKWRDIMSYKESCGGCPRLPVWSSPKVLVKGEPAGTPDLDNARVVAEQAARVAAFR
jgi:hypothetical protein